MQILLVDDDDLFFDLVRWIVKKDPVLGVDVSVIRMRDGEEALQFFADAAQGIMHDGHRWPDLVLLDQRMPRLDGTEVLRRLREAESTRTLPICMLSSSNQSRLVDEAYAAGANFYFVKPFELEDLQSKLRKIVEFMTDVAELPPPVRSSYTVN